MKYKKLIICCDGGGASGKSTGAKLISKKFKLNLLNSGLLYRWAAKLIIEKKPKNKVSFLKKKFLNLNYKSIVKLNLHTQDISNLSAIIAKQKKIRLILKLFQKKFAKKYKKVCIEGRDIGTVILPRADIKFFFKCDLNTAAKRRFKELKKSGRILKLSQIKKSLKIRNYRDISRKNSPLLKSRDAIIVDTGKLNNIPDMVKLMSKIIEKKINRKYGS